MIRNKRIQKAQEITDLEFEPITACPGCGSTENEVWSRDTIKISEVLIKVRKCTTCELVYCDHLLTEESTLKYFENYSKNRNVYDSKLAQQREEMYRVDHRLINQHVSSPKSIIDIGCSDGKFISLFKEVKEKYGIEIDASAADDARLRVPGLKIVTDTLGLSTGSIDLVIFRGTLQYQRNLKSIIKECLRILSPVGVIAILANPNPDSPVAEITRENWGLFDPLEHLTYFSSPCLSKLFTPVKIFHQDFPYIDSPYANPREDLKCFRDLILNPESANGSFPFWGSISNSLLRRV